MNDTWVVGPTIACQLRGLISTTSSAPSEISTSPVIMGAGIATVGCAVAEPCGAGALTFGGLFVATVLVHDLYTHFVKGGSNRKQNQEFQEAVRRIEAARGGQPLSPDQIRRLHDEISGQGFTLDEIVAIGLAMFPPK